MFVISVVRGNTGAGGGWGSQRDQRFVRWFAAGCILVRRTESSGLRV